MDAKNEIRYHITLEPTPQKWLFPLDLPVNIPRYTALTADFQLIRRFPIPRRARYSMSSRLRYNTGPLTEQERVRGLQLPDNITPRIRALVDQWRQESANDSALIERALRYFRQQEFYYTLHPPIVDKNPTDQFLFETRRGFCEHYATSFTLLMRIAGIPSRVVVGYQGGEFNPIGSYLIVRQSDAHAWAEVWLRDKGWVRIDPTAAVAPERIEQSLDIDQIGEQIGAPIRFDSGQLDFLRSFAQQIAWGVDALNASWHRWVLGYSRERQSWLMELMGLGFLRGTRLAYGMVGFTALVVIALGILTMVRSREGSDPVQRLYLRFCRRLERRGLIRRPHEGPKDFGQRIIAWRPDLKEAVEQITRLYIGIRYGRLDTRTNRKRLTRLVRLFRP
jgi:transglutaminase-like putative cysteine protease